MLNLVIAITIASIFCIVAYYRKWLDKSGAVAATILGTFVWIAGGVKLAIPMLAFFLSGSLLGKLNKQPLSADEKFNKPRDYIQVISNGSVAAFCLLLFLITHSPVFITAYFISIAISTSDTWSSELGILFGGKVVDILTGRQVAKGLSGGVSVKGTIAGVAAALLIALLYWLIYPAGYLSFALVWIFGFLGMVIDSVMGSKWQAAYRLDNGTQKEFIGENEKGRIIKGFSWMTNDLVNLLSNLFITFFGALIIHVFTGGTAAS